MMRAVYHLIPLRARHYSHEGFETTEIANGMTSLASTYTNGDVKGRYKVEL